VVCLHVTVLVAGVFGGPDSAGMDVGAGSPMGGRDHGGSRVRIRRGAHRLGDLLAQHRHPLLMIDHLMRDADWGCPSGAPECSYRAL
jgi:hypothetical protein